MIRGVSVALVAPFVLPAVSSTIAFVVSDKSTQWPGRRLAARDSGWARSGRFAAGMSRPPSPSPESAALSPPPISPDKSAIEAATQALLGFDEAQRSYIAEDGNEGMGGGTSALHFLQRSLTPNDRNRMRDAVQTLVAQASCERSDDSAQGRVMLGFCASNAPEALAGLKSWVTALSLPRGLLHGMDVDGVPMSAEELGAVYVKYSTGGAMTFTEMRKSGMGFDALWRPGDALLEPYDGDFRGVYLNVELADDIFRQFGVLPTDLFMEEEDW